MSEHTPGPWTVIEYGDEEAPNLVIHSEGEMRVCFMATPGSNGDPAMITADARLIAAAPVMLAQLLAVRALIAEGAMTGFNPLDGDWADRLFKSQGQTTDAINKATNG